MKSVFYPYQPSPCRFGVPSSLFNSDSAGSSGSAMLGGARLWSSTRLHHSDASKERRSLVLPMIAANEVLPTSEFGFERLQRPTNRRSQPEHKFHLSEMKLLLFPLLLLAACGKQDAPHASATALPSASVKTQHASRQPHTATEEVVGTVRSKQRAVIEAKISGRVLEYTATPGTMVKAGDLLARLDAQEIQAKVDQARAMLDQAKRDFDRQKQLIDSKATTRQEFDTADARVKVGTGALSEAETMMSYAKVTAPFDGVVTRKLANLGDLAMPGKPLLEIEAPTSLRFEADVPEAILDRVKIGAKLPVRLAQVVEGTVSEISPVADPVSRTFNVKLDLPPTEGIRTGQFGRVSVPVAEVMLLLVPQSAVLKRGQMELVFVEKDGKAALRLVKTGKVLEVRVEVLSGLEEGEQVIVSDTAKLTDGQPVTLHP